MEKQVIITALVDRPTLALRAGDRLELTVGGDMLVKLSHEQALGLIDVAEKEDGKEP